MLMHSHIFRHVSKIEIIVKNLLCSNQMVASPALVPSPSPQHAIMAVPQRSVGMLKLFVT